MAFWLNLGGGNLEARFMDVGCRAAGAEPGIFVWGGPSVTLIYLSRQLLRTYIYTYARFFIIYTHFLFDKLYIYKKKKKKVGFSYLNW